MFSWHTGGPRVADQWTCGWKSFPKEFGLGCFAESHKELEEMASGGLGGGQLAKSSLCKHGDLTPSLGARVKAGCGVHAYNPSAEKRREEGGPEACGRAA